MFIGVIIEPIYAAKKNALWYISCVFAKSSFLLPRVYPSISPINQCNPEYSSCIDQYSSSYPFKLQWIPIDIFRYIDIFQKYSHRYFQHVYIYIYICPIFQFISHTHMLHDAGIFTNICHNT